MHVKAVLSVVITGLSAALAYVEGPVSAVTSSRVTNTRGPVMFGRPKISAAKGGAAKTVVKPIEYSEAIPFAKKPEKLDGTMLGDIGFDPWGLSNFVDLNFARAAELKHGRVGMLAALGFMVQEIYRLPFEPFVSVKSPIDALSTVPGLGIAQILLAVSLIEVATSGNAFVASGFFDQETLSVSEVDTGKTAPGDLEWDPMGLGLADDPFIALAELKHARLGMIGAAGMLAQAIVNPDKSLFEVTASWVGYPIA